jgi:hypothetical protein
LRLACRGRLGIGRRRIGHGGVLNRAEVTVQWRREDGRAVQRTSTPFQKAMRSAISAAADFGSG